MMVLPALKVSKATPGQPVCQAPKARKVIPVALKVRKVRKALKARLEPMAATVLPEKYRMRNSAAPSAAQARTRTP
jgi:hypothetical protein